MIILTSKYLVPKGYAGMAVFPFIFLKNRKYLQNSRLLNHEKIHLRQQAELLIIPFYIWYIGEYIVLLIKYQNREKAYRSVIFEKEAYAEEHHNNYLTKRPFWNFIKYR